MVLLGASGLIVLSLSSAMIEDVGECIGISKRLPKNVSEVSSLPLLFLSQTLMHSEIQTNQSNKINK